MSVSVLGTRNMTMSKMTGQQTKFMVVIWCGKCEKMQHAHSVMKPEWKNI
jgi:hypothetical protein